MLAAVNRFYDSHYFRPHVVWRTVRKALWDAHERKRRYDWSRRVSPVAR
jgi:hypothetical protein